MAMCGPGRCPGSLGIKVGLHGSAEGELGKHASLQRSGEGRGKHRVASKRHGLLGVESWGNIEPQRLPGAGHPEHHAGTGKTRWVIYLAPPLEALPPCSMKIS